MLRRQQLNKPSRERKVHIMTPFVCWKQGRLPATRSRSHPSTRVEFVFSFGLGAGLASTTTTTGTTAVWPRQAAMRSAATCGLKSKQTSAPLKFVFVHTTLFISVFRKESDDRPQNHSTCLITWHPDRIVSVIPGCIIGNRSICQEVDQSSKLVRWKMFHAFHTARLHECYTRIAVLRERNLYFCAM